jgi:predicted DNA-binding ribbon-helix-helix protein
MRLFPAAGLEVSMCRLFIEGDPDLWEYHTRSLRLHGLATSLRLETFFWNILTEIAGRDGLTLSQLVAKLYDELVEARGEPGNFTSFLRVCCGRYLALQVQGEVPADPAIPIRSLDASGILARERARGLAYSIRDRSEEHSRRSAG